jgi:hypothetical protein
MVSVVAALSYRNDSRELLDRSDSSQPPPRASTTHFSASFRYASVGVNRSAGMEAVMGSRFGGNWEFLDCEMTSRAVSSDGTLAT